MVKLLLYVITIPVVVWSVDSINFNSLFKKGEVNQYRARIFYMIFVLSISYLIVSFLYDFLGVIS
jgi:uncharacterized membrane protein YwzB